MIKRPLFARRFGATGLSVSSVDNNDAEDSTLHGSLNTSFGAPTAALLRQSTIARHVATLCTTNGVSLDSTPLVDCSVSWSTECTLLEALQRPVQLARRDVDNASRYVLALCVHIEPSLDALRSYAERFGPSVPLSASTGYATHCNPESTLLAEQRKREEQRATQGVSLSGHVGGRKRTKSASMARSRQRTLLQSSALHTENTSALELAAVIPHGNELYARMEKTEPVSLEMLMYSTTTNVADKQEHLIDTDAMLRKWQKTVCSTGSMRIMILARGYVRREYIGQLAPLVSGHYVLSADLLTKSPDKADEKFCDMGMYNSSVFNTFSHTTDNDDCDEFGRGGDDDAARLDFLDDTQFLFHVLTEDAFDGQESADNSSSTSTEDDGPIGRVVDRSEIATLNGAEVDEQVCDLIQGSATLRHELDALATIDLDALSWYECNRAARDRLSVLLSLCAHTEREEYMQEMPNPVHVHKYPHGPGAPVQSTLVNAPGTLATTSAEAYAALGLALLCAATSSDNDMAQWLLYAETLHACFRRKTNAHDHGVQTHVDGVLCAIKTSNIKSLPPLLAELMNELSDVLRDTVNLDYAETDEDAAAAAVEEEADKDIDAYAAMDSVAFLAQAISE